MPVSQLFAYSMTGLLLSLPGLLPGQVIITEIDAINSGSARDADGNQRDWIELRNTGESPVNLAGWALSDGLDNPGMWTFPEVTLPAGEHLLVFASGKDWRIPGYELHTNFSLSEGGEDVVLSQPDGNGGWTLAHLIAGYPPQRSGLSYGYAGSTGTGQAGYFESPTPGSLNGPSVVTQFVQDTKFDHVRGFYSSAFTLRISTATPGATIIYTLDGSEPAAGNGIQVPAPSEADIPVATIPVATTAIVRARAVKDGLGRTNVDTHTYIFPSAVLNQDASYVTQPYASWGHDKPGTASADWAMDPRVTGHENPEDRCVPEDLQKIPTVSIVMNWADLFGNWNTEGERGIYIEGEGIDKPASFEIINPDGNDLDPNLSPADHGRGVVRVFGGSSTEKRWKTDKLSLRFNFHDDFESVVLGKDAVGAYDRLVLDARLNQVWTQSQNFEQRQFADYVRDAVLTDLENEMGVKSVHSQHVHLFLNGFYWGLYTLHERPDSHFAAAYFGGDKDDYDIVKHGPNEPNFIIDGMRIDPTAPVSNTNHTAAVHYLEMVQLASADLGIPANYDALATRLDVPALIDHILSNFYGGNYDWPQHNWYASLNRVNPEGKWRFHSWDAEHVFKYVDYPRYDNVTAKFEGWDRPDGIHLQLLQNSEYRFRFADAAHRYLFNGGPFEANKVWAIFERRLDDIDEAIRAESARWGDNGQQNIDSTNPLAEELHLRYSNIPSTVPESWIGQSDTTDFASWWHERERIRTQILGPAPNRATRFLTQLREAVYGEDHPLEGQPNPLYPETDAPVFNQHGGHVEAGFLLELSHPNAAGISYYTTDGSDPRLPYSGNGSPFSGEVSSTAMTYNGPVTISSTTRIKARVFNGAEWSALTEARFTVGFVPASSDNLVISEIHYHPANPTLEERNAGFTDDGEFEYFEVLNIGTETVSLDGLSMQQGLEIAFVNEGITELSPGEFALFAANPQAFAFRYGNGFPIAGQFIMGTSLSNGGERLHLLAEDGSTIVNLVYDDSSPWPAEPDGEGPSLVLIQPGYRDPQSGWNWRPSAGMNGSPNHNDFLSYEDWSQANFSPSDPGYPTAAEPGADPEGDGLSNLEELFFGTDPWEITDTASVRPKVTLETLNTGAGPAPYAVFSFRYVKIAEEVSFEVVSSSNLDTWVSGSLIPLEPPEDHGDGTETRRYRTLEPVSGELPSWFTLSLRLTVP